MPPSQRDSANLQRAARRSPWPTRRVASSASPGTALPIYLSIFNARQTLMDKLTPLHPLPLPSECASCNENAICLSCHNAGHTNRVSCVKHPLCGRVCLLNVTVIWRFSSCFSLSAPSLTIIFVCLQQLRACVMALLTSLLCHLPPSSRYNVRVRARYV